jgi:hypothetical protein
MLTKRSGEMASIAQTITKMTLDELYNKHGDYELVLAEFVRAVTGELSDVELNRVNQRLVDIIKK